MATKKKTADPAKKLLLTAIKKTINHNAVLPILEDVYLTGKEAVMTDLGNSVIIPFKTPNAKGVCVPANMLVTFLEMMENPDIVSDKNFGVTASEGKRVVKVMGENPDNYPVVPMFNKTETERGDQPYPSIGNLVTSDMESLEDALSFVSKDDLRPAMTGVFFEQKGVEASKTSWMVATDAHRLFWKPISDLTESFTLPAKAAKILLALGGEWALTSDSHQQIKDGKVVYKQPTMKVRQLPAHFIENGVAYKGDKSDNVEMYEKYWKDNYESFTAYCEDRLDDECFNLDDENQKEWVEVPDPDKKPEPVFVDATHICFERKDGVKVITRIIDARFPNYRVVIPEGVGNVIATVGKEEMLRELKNASKFANKSTHQVTLGMNGSFTISSQDVDWSFEYKNDIDGTFEIKDTLPKEYELNGKPARIIKDLGTIVKVSFNGKEKDIMRTELTELPPHLYIAFNGNFLAEIVNKIPKGEPVKIKMWAPTKAAIINENYLVMPLMLNS